MKTTPPAALFSRNPVRWLTVFGPGAIMASLTIGTGELIFSSRGGALFGYSILWVFLAVSILKWALVFSTARHMVLTGVHPFERSMDLPGPRGWLPLLFFLPAVLCYPIWVGFHSEVIGSLINNLWGMDKHLGGGAVLCGILVLVFAGGYNHLERIQIILVGLMLGCVGISAILLNPNWLDVLEGLLVPRTLSYPDWLAVAEPGVASRSIWVETITYVGVIGGASYDYLAYVSFLREKSWGLSSSGPASAEELEAIAADPQHPVRQWIRAPLVDCTLSFIIVVLFSAVFVVSGALVLGPAHTIPTGDNLLNLQANFVTRLHPWLFHLYVVGAFLTMAGTLYGTLEIAPATTKELIRAVKPSLIASRERRLRNITVLWCALGAFGVLAWSYRVHSTESDAPTPIEIITPANLFTGVFSCTFICFMIPWMERRFLPPQLRMGFVLTAINILAGVIFLAIGVWGYWEYGAKRSDNAVLGGTVALLIVLAVFGLSWVLAWAIGRIKRS